MPQNNSEKNGVSLKNLEEYYDSLEELVNNYENTHEVPKSVSSPNRSLSKDWGVFFISAQYIRNHCVLTTYQTKRYAKNIYSPKRITNRNYSTYGARAV